MQNGIRILQEAGYDNWAAYLAEDSNFQALVDGASWPDFYKGRWNLKLKFRVFKGLYEKDLGTFDLSNYGGWDHYLSNYYDLQHPERMKGLEDVDETAIAGFFLDAFSDLAIGGAMFASLAAAQALLGINPASMPIAGTIAALQSLGVMGLALEFSPPIHESYPSTALLAQYRFDNALESHSASANDLSPVYWEHKSRQYDSLFQLGWATHYATDGAVIYHLQNAWDNIKLGPWGNPHDAYEGAANGRGDPNANSGYHIQNTNEWKIGKNYNLIKEVGGKDYAAASIIQEGALAVDQPGHWTLATSDNSDYWEIPLKNGIRISEQMTAAILARYMDELGIPPVVPPLEAMVYDTNYNPVPGAYVFYREKYGHSGDPDAPMHIEQDKPWDFVTADQYGRVTLNLKEGYIYAIRAEYPGYRYAGYQDAASVDIEFPKNFPITGGVLEFTQPVSGKATTTHWWNLYLSPVTPEIQPTAASQTPKFISLADKDPILPFANDFSPEIRTDLVDATIKVRADSSYLAAQAPGEPYPLALPGETYIEIECANLLNIGTAQTAQSPQQLEAVLVDTGTKWETYHQIQRNPAGYYQLLSTRTDVVTTAPQKDAVTEVSSILHQEEGPVLRRVSTDSDFDTDADTLKLVSLEADAPVVDTGYSPFAISRMMTLAPQGQEVLPDGRESEVPLLTYSLGPLFEGGQSLYEKHLSRIPAANAKIEVTMISYPGYIGPDYSIIPVSSKMVQVEDMQVTDLPGAQQKPQLNVPPQFQTQESSQPTKTTVKTLTLTTNSEGLAALRLKTGNQAGRILLQFNVIDNPGAPGVKVRDTLGFMVLPPITRVDPGFAIVPPSLGVVALRTPLVLLYTIPEFGTQKTVVDPGTCFNFSEGAGGTILVDMYQCTPGPVIVSKPEMARPMEVVEQKSPPSGIISGFFDFLRSIPQKIISLFGGEPEELPEGANCDDGNVCTTGDHYSNGVCTGRPVSCDDGNPMTEDYCDPAVGCVHEEIGGPIREGPCDDGNACSTNDRYEGGVCVGGPPPDCDDGNPMTENYCDPERGCVHEQIGEGIREGPCDDGN
ncbi:MAG: hypothetical protein RQ758_02185, partial [Methanomicrobiaceae archaeon]|nr:hypothetical protein [Methanomicrobiaceae archaeon]